MLKHFGSVVPWKFCITSPKRHHPIQAAALPSPTSDSKSAGGSWNQHKH